jgi:SAM-dependent methyltransferase
MTPFERLHQRYIVNRRAERLSRHLASAIPAGPQRLLDVGCGTGLVSRLVRQLRPEIEILGIDLCLPADPQIAVAVYDGEKLPYAADEFDVVLLIDVLHHTIDPAAKLVDALRVARNAVIVKDHLREGFYAERRLKFMDTVGNRRFGVPLPFNYWRRAEWRETFRCLGVEPDVWLESLRLYPWPLRIVFDARLHFLVRLPAGRSGKNCDRSPADTDSSPIPPGSSA